MCRDMDDSTSLDDMSFEVASGVQHGSSNSVNLSVATTDSSSSSSGCELSKTKVSLHYLQCLLDTFIELLECVLVVLISK